MSTAVYVTFEGYFYIGKEREFVLFQSRKIASPLSFSFGAEQTIIGLEEATRTMKEGEKKKEVQVLPQHAFGAGGNPHGFHGSGEPIPPHATLVFKDLTVIHIDTPNQSPIEIKEAGNKYFRQRNIEMALFKYEKALGMIQKDKTKDNKAAEVQCLSNVAACHLKLNKLRNVLTTTDEILLLEPNNLKAMFRKAKAQMGLKEYECAVLLCNMGLQIEANNKDFTILKKKAVQFASKEEQKQKKVCKGIFDKMHEEGSLYAKQEPGAPSMAKCRICGEEVAQIQLARHIIKKHSEK